MSKDIEKWLAKSLSEYSEESKLSPRAIEDELDRCKKIAKRIKEMEGLTSEEAIDLYDSCATGILNGEEPEDVLRRRRLNTR